MVFGFWMCGASPYLLWGDVYIKFTEHHSKLKFSMQTYLTLKNIIFKNCNASVILENSDVLYLEDGNTVRPVLKHNTTTMFFSKQKIFFSNMFVFQGLADPKSE